MAKIVVTFDGTAASGKGAIARGVADHFGFLYLDTGRLYRALAHLIRLNGLEEKEFLSQIALLSKQITPKLLADNVLYEGSIGDLASKIASLPEVREALLQYQLDFIENNEAVVLDGRDTGTVICPGAKYKFYVDADVNVRAKRRYMQQEELGLPEQSYEEILRKLVERDERDKNREVAPLVVPEGAVVIDNVEMPLSEVIAKAIELIDYSKSKS